jgi:hypothetical protein
MRSKKLVATNKILEGKLKGALNFSNKCSCEGTTVMALKPCAFHMAWLKSRLKLAEGED